MKNKYKEALINMLEQFGTNFALSAVEDACALLKHPKTQYYNEKDNDCCYCRMVVYSKVEAMRRRKIKSKFIDKT